VEVKEAGMQSWKMPILEKMNIENVLLSIYGKLKESAL